MNYTTKDIYITLLPGFNLIVWACVFFWIVEGESSMLLQQTIALLEEATALMVLLVPLLSILIGCFINQLSGRLLKGIYYLGWIYSPDYRAIKDNNIISIADVEKKSKQVINKEANKARHTKQAQLPVSAKIEEYFVRYSHARNLCASELIIGIASLVMYFVLGHPLFLLLIAAGHALCFWSLVYSYRYQSKRYIETIFDEYNNLKRLNIKP